MKLAGLRHALSGWGGWLTLILISAVYYPRFGKGFSGGPDGVALYTSAAQCLLHGEPLLPCAPTFPYQPALAAVMIPLALLPPVLQKPVWYVVCVGALVLTARLTEEMAARLYPGAVTGRNLIWLRVLSLFICSKQIELVIDYQAYDGPALAMMTLGIWTLCVGRDAASGLWLGIVAAIRASPLIYLPYLAWQRRYLACAIFIAACAVVSLLPDLLSMAVGGHSGYFADWVRQVAARGVVPGSDVPTTGFWHGWFGDNFSNQSLRGVIRRVAPVVLPGVNLAMLQIAVLGLFVLLVLAILAISPRRNEYRTIDGAVLLIAILALSPITSRYHFIFVYPAVILVAAAIINDARMRLLGSVVLAASFILLTGTSNDLVGHRVTEFAYRYGFGIAGAIVLLAALAAMLWLRPAEVADKQSDAAEYDALRSAIAR